MSTREEKIAEFLEAFPGARWGPAHIVLEDGNLEQHHIDWCRGIIAGVQFARQGTDYHEHSDLELAATEALLRRLEGHRESDWKKVVEAHAS